MRSIAFLFHIILKQKNRATLFIFVPDFSGDSRMVKVSYAYEIYYVPNSSGSQSNVL
jgi:hypothetical protein